MTAEPRWLEVARAESMRGVTEIAGREFHNERILEYHQATDLHATADEVPWCSSFVNWCLRRADMPRTRSAAARSWLSWGLRLSPPALGVIVILKRGGLGQPGREVRDAPGHVGFYVGHGSKYEILVLGGNQENAVNTRAYNVDRVLDYRWPISSGVDG